jgi:hypothetical protein
MKTEHDRQQLIKDINVLLHQAYDSTLDEIYALLKRIDDIEDEEDLLAIKEAREDIRINGTVSWEEIEEEIRNDRKQDAA